MKIPSKIKVGRCWYSVIRVENLPRRHGKKICGVVNYDTKEIKYVPSGGREDRDTFWHELTHAILHEMDTAFRSERFVERFADYLSKAIDSAKF